ncbi:MAG: DUF3467 domain-containing protein [Actinomycetota bacterium]
MGKDDQKNVINIDMGSVEPVYSNMVNIIHGPFDFTVNFLQVSPPTGKVATRVMMSPQHAKAFLNALADNIRKYENTHGEIKLAAPQPGLNEPKIGFN